VAAISPAHSQKEIRQILANARHFDTAVKQAEAYFAAKYPDLSANQLCEGEHRDGDFVKFMRWKNYWQHQLNPDGTLGDPTAYYRARSTQNRGGGEIFNDIPWTNLSYENYITYQIGLGRTTSIGFHPTDPNTFYVGAAIGGIWKTTDGGNSYVPLGDELPFLAVSSIVVNKDNPQIIYAALSDHVWYGPPGIGVYKSNDGGLSWESTALTFNFTENIRIYWMSADPQDADRVFVATAGGLYRTDDGFETVVEVNNLNCFDIKVLPSNPDVWLLGLSNGFLHRSIDDGISFAPVTQINTGPCLIATTSDDPNRVYCRSNATMKRSFDGGSTFDVGVSLPEGNTTLEFAPGDPNTLIIGNFEVHKSINNGTSFYPITHWLGDNGLELIHVDQRNAFVNPLNPEKVYFCNDGGVYALHIQNEIFDNLCNGLLITQFYDIAVSQSNEMIIGGGSQDNGNVFRNSNGIWQDYAGTGDGMTQEIDPDNSGIRYWTYQLGGMRRYQNGNNVGIAPPGLDGTGSWETPFKLDYSNPERLICAFDQVYESFNRGNSWTNIGPTGIGSGDMEQLAISPSDPNRIYIVRGNKLWKKNTFDNNWEEHTLPGGGISDLEVDPQNMDLVYITMSGYSDGNKVFRSFDGGGNWENISGMLPNVSTGAIETYSVVEGALFVGTDAGVYYRDNTITEWQLYGQIPNTRVEDIEIQYAAQKIRIGTHGRGVLEAPVTIGVCDGGMYDGDGDGLCDEIDQCPGFDDTLLDQPCDDNNPNTINDIWIDCEICEGIEGVDVLENLATPLLIYPNPSSGIFHIQCENHIGNLIKVYDVQGKLVLQKMAVNASETLNLKGWNKGIYSVIIGTEVNKIILE
jgi:photosystem II stability/assembly factor-like uncharacterized protein